MKEITLAVFLSIVLIVALAWIPFSDMAGDLIGQVSTEPTELLPLENGTPILFFVVVLLIALLIWMVVR
ncbi:MAG: hypothetical protein QXT02_05405 [Candidatus Hadarchaeum sp.]